MKKPSAMIKKQFIAALLLTFFQSQFCLAQDQPAPNVRRETAVLRVGSSFYNSSDLIGTSLASLKSEFDDKIINVPDDSVERLLRHQAGLSEDDLSLLKNRSEKVDKLWIVVRNRTLDDALRIILLGRIRDSVSLLHRVKLSDHYDFDVLEDALNRQVEYLKFRWQNQERKDDKELFSEAKRRFRFARLEVYWTATSEEFRHRPFFMRWPVRTLEPVTKPLV